MIPIIITCVVALLVSAAGIAFVNWPSGPRMAARPKAGATRITQDPHTLKCGVEQYQSRPSIAGSFSCWRPISQWFDTPDQAEAWLTAERRRTIVLERIGDQWIAVDGQ